jgi:SAM-dependent methyltransferase
VTWNPERDKAEELSRFEERAKGRIPGTSGRQFDRDDYGAASFSRELRAPYLAYEEAVRRLVRPGGRVLELGSGMGRHTKVLIDTGASVTASDISPEALAVIERTLGPAARGRLETRVADIEALPFADASFDAVACAGSLCYGDPVTVDSEIRRVLKPGGSLVLVDTLNHNPIYRLNRWIHFLRGDRTRSTLVRMSTVSRIESIARHFQDARVLYFGAISWAMPIVSRITGAERAGRFSDAVDRLVGARRSAFKFVLVANELRKTDPSPLSG